MTRALRVLSLGLPLAVAACWWHLFAATTAWTTPVQWVISALLAGGALATTVATWRGAARVHVVIAGGLLACQALILFATLAGVRLVAYDLFPDARLAVVIGASLLLAIYGLVRGRQWGRGLALALGAVGAVSGGINVAHYWAATAAPNPADPDWSNEVYLTAWILCVSTLGGALVAANLAAPVVRAAFAARAKEAWASSNHRALAWVRPMVVTAFAAVPMLLVYAWLQPITPATQDTALGLAAVLALGGVLAVRGKVIGALLLVVAGLGLFAQTAATVLGADAGDATATAGYYAVFWLPAAVCALACGVRVAGPTWRILRGTSG